jgi:HK97 family phage major capsid protein
LEIFVKKNPLIVAAEAALEKRSVKFAERQVVIADTGLTAADKRSRIEAIDADMVAYATEAEGHVRAAEAEIETRGLNEQASSLSNARGNRGEWRGLLPSSSEWRNTLVTNVSADGGVTVPTRVAGYWIDKLRNTSVILRSGVQVIEFNDGVFKLPMLSGSNTPGVVAENTAIAMGDTDWTGLTFTPVGYKDLQSASNEILADSALPLRNVLADMMVRNIAAKIDTDAINGTGTGSLKGILAAGNNTKTTLGAALTWDAVYDAYAAIEATGAQPSVILASPDAAAALRKAKASTAGTYLAGNVSDAPPGTAMGLPLLVSGSFPAKSVVVMAADRVYLGRRQDFLLSVSTEFLYDKDAVAFRATTRFAGLVAAEATSIQWVLGI